MPATMNENKENMENQTEGNTGKGGLLQKIRNLLVLQDGTKEKVLKRDPVTWHRLLMAIVISYVGILSLVAVGFDFALESRMDGYDRKALRGENFSHLPSGEYHVFMLYPSKLNESVLHEGDIIVVAGKEGGILLSVKSPGDIDLPKDFYDHDCYFLKVSGEGTWEFVPTDHLEFMRNEMELRKKLYEDYRKEQLGETEARGEASAPVSP